MFEQSCGHFYQIFNVILHMPWRSSGLGKGGATTLISLAKETTPQLIVRKFPYKNSKPVSLVSNIKVVAPPLPRPGNHALFDFLYILHVIVIFKEISHLILKLVELEMTQRI